jgi:4-amino-4-deoxy-L-arabinose transferase-like glycosyltransferase
MEGHRAIQIFLLALVVRVAFVLWAPGEPTGDGFFYHVLGHELMVGKGYVNVDGSPANTWMPGWPAFLALLYGTFGVHARLAMAVNALLGAATAVLVARLGARLVGGRVGELAGALYAIWPGLVYFSATLFNESLFGLLLVIALSAVVSAAEASDRRPLRFALAGLSLGACAWVKAEPLVLCLPVVAYLFVSRKTKSAFLREVAILLAVTGAVVVPWTIRNYVVFDRFIPTAAGGGMVIYAANHPGASGGNDMVSLLAYARELGVEDLTQAEQNIAINDRAWADVRGFVAEDPAEALRRMGRKLVLTYGGDSEGADIVRGFYGPEQWHLEASTWRRLVVVADIFWLLMAIACAIGVLAARRWPLPSRVLVFGTLATWLILHLIFMGGMRFHVPEITLLAIVAAAGIERVHAFRARA